MPNGKKPFVHKYLAVQKPATTQKALRANQVINAMRAEHARHIRRWDDLSVEEQEVLKAKVRRWIHDTSTSAT